MPGAVFLKLALLSAVLTVPSLFSQPPCFVLAQSHDDHHRGHESPGGVAAERPITPKEGVDAPKHGPPTHGPGSAADPDKAPIGEGPVRGPLEEETPVADSPTDATTVAFDFEGDDVIDYVLANYVSEVLGGELGVGGGVGTGDASIILRWLSMVHTVWFDALAPYHATAVGVYSNLGRRPESESETNADMSVSVLFASHKVLNWLQPDDADVWDTMLTDIGLEPTDTHEGTEDPIGIGNAAAAALIAARSHDGFNQLGTEDGRKYHPEPYWDYTGFSPENSAYNLIDARKWQPQVITDSFGLRKVQAFVTPQYALTDAFSYRDSGEFSVPEPEKSYDVAKDGTGTPGDLYKEQVDEVLAVQTSITEKQKLLAEFFDHKFRSLGGSAYAARINQNLTLVELAHLEFAVNMAAHDAGVVVWKEKTKWNAVRPFTAVAKTYPDTEITAYGGPEVQTVDDMLGREWKPYLQSADHPEYPSASASFCAAQAIAAQLVLGTDDLGYEVEWSAGESTAEPAITPAAETTHTFATWSQFAEECGNSRVWAGVHFPAAVPAGRSIGYEIGERAFKFYQDHVKNEGDAGILHGYTGGK